MENLTFDEFFQVNPGLNGEQNLNPANTFVDTKQQNNKKNLLLKGFLLGAGIVFCIYNKDKILALFFGKGNEESESEDIKI
jgi:hypothetical protein